MKKLVLLFLGALLSYGISAQNEEIIEQSDTSQVFTIVEQMPQFPGGEAEMYKFLAENLKYPPGAKDAGLQGTVYVKFIVFEDGSIRNVTILRGIGGGCDEEALRVIQSMPNWNPGMQRGKPVRVQYIMPFKFTLRQGENEKKKKKKKKKNRPDPKAWD